MVFFLSLPILVLNSAATFVYPLYASYKAITSPTRSGSTVSSYSWANRPDGAAAGTEGATTEMAELETWLMYWSVIACIQTAETFLEWSWSWIPFYFECKLLFTLWLVLPQTRGATYLYIHHVAPFLAAHEQDIDVALGKAKGKLKASASASVERAWNMLRDSITSEVTGQGATARAPTAGNSGSAAPPPSAQNPAQGAATQLFGLLRALAPAAASGATAILDRATVGAKESQAPVTAMKNPGKGGGKRVVSARAAPAGAAPLAVPLDRAQAAKRRAELERQLAELNTQEQAAGSSSAAGVSASTSALNARRIPTSLQAGGKPRAASAAVGRGDAPPALRQRGNRLVSQPAPSGGAENDNGSDEVSDEAQYRSEKSPLDGSYAVLDRADAPRPTANAAGKRKASAAAAAAATAAQKAAQAQADESGGWTGWLRRGDGH